MHPQIRFVQGGFAGYASPLDLADAPGCAQDVQWHVTSCESLVAPLVYASTKSVASRSVGVSGEAQEAVCSKLCSIYPDAHVLIVTRGFRSVLFSGFSQGVRAGHDAPFSTLLAVGEDRDGRGRFAWNYDHLVGLYQRAFAERVIVLPYELLRDHPARFVSELSRHMGIEPHLGPTDRLNEALSPEELAWLPAVSSLIRRLPLPNGVKQRMFEAYKKRIGGRFLKALSRLLQKLAPKPRPHPDLIANEIVGHFRGRASCLAELPVFEPYQADYLLTRRTS
jgi:hypothetical protein